MVFDDDSINQSNSGMINSRTGNDSSPSNVRLADNSTN